ncbi:MAG: Sensor protein kdpD [Actinomycetia bacterium]|nr:Sensor protein kdpD [Actinomycetes bacterium]
MSTAPASPRRGRRAGLAVAVAGLAALTAGLAPVRENVPLATVTLAYLVPVVVAAVAGGIRPALAAAITADLLVNFFFVPPYRTFAVERWDNVVVLGVYIAVAATVAVAVDVAARQRATAARRALETALLARTTAQPVTEDSLTDLLAQVRDTFGMTSVSLVDQAGNAVAAIGPDPGGEPSLTTPPSGGVRILAWGPALIGEDRRVLAQLTSAAARTLEAQRLAAAARNARELAEIDRLRTALLTAVGHDLRTPLTAIKAASSSLRQPDVDFAPEDRAELIATIDESADALSALVENLLALSRLQAGVLSLDLRPVALDAVAAQAVLAVAGSGEIDVHVPDDLPLALADAGLLERAVANLVANARTASPAGTPVRVAGRRDGDRVLLDVIDHGPGVLAADRDRIFQPFQRLHDRGGGLGLGLAIARGFTEAMDGTLTATGTPGGGLTMTVSLPIAAP